MKGYILEWAGLYMDAISYFLEEARSEEHSIPERLAAYNAAARIASLLGLKDTILDIQREVEGIDTDGPLKRWIQMSIAGYIRVSSKIGRIEAPTAYEAGSLRFTVEIAPAGVRVKGYIEKPDLEHFKEFGEAVMGEDYVIVRMEVDGVHCIAFVNSDGAVDVRIAGIIDSPDEGLRLASSIASKISAVVKP